MTDTVEFEFTPDRAYARRFLRQATRRLRMLFYGIGLVLVLSGIAGVCSDGWGVFGGLLALWCAATLVVGAAGMVVRSVGRLPKDWYAPRRYVLDPAGLTLTTGRFEVTYRWHAVQRVQTTKHGYLVYLSGGLSFVDIPTDGLPVERAAEVRSLLDRPWPVEAPPDGPAIRPPVPDRGE
jgi:hypothetical protein